MAAPRPEHAHATARPATVTPLPRPAHTTTGWRQDRRPVVSKRPLHSLAAAKMSPHIHIGPEPVLAAHARSLPAAGSRCPAGADSAPHSEQNFLRTVRNDAHPRTFRTLADLDYRDTLRLDCRDAPPLECSVRSDKLPVPMRMHFCRGPMRMTLSCSACTCVCLKLLSRFRETYAHDPVLLCMHMRMLEIALSFY